MLQINVCNLPKNDFQKFRTWFDFHSLCKHEIILGIQFMGYFLWSLAINKFLYWVELLCVRVYFLFVLFAHYTNRNFFCSYSTYDNNIHILMSFLLDTPWVQPWMLKSVQLGKNCLNNLLSVITMCTIYMKLFGNH